MGRSLSSCSTTTSTASPRRSSAASRTSPPSAAAGHPALRQRPVHVQPRRQPARRADPRHARNVGGVRGDGRAVAGRRCRPVARQLDDRRRPAATTSGDGRRPLRRLGHARLHQRQGPRELLAAVPHHVPQRGAAGRPPVAHDARSTTASPSTTRCGAPASGSSTRCGSSAPVSSRSRTSRSTARTRSSRGRGVAGRARAGRPQRVLQLRQVPRHRARAPPTGCRACSPTGCPKIGRTHLTAMLNPQGRIVGEFSVAADR